MDAIEDIIQFVYPAVGWIWVDQIPVHEVFVRDVVRVLIPHNQGFIPRDEIQIRGFINIRHRRWVRYFRELDREANDFNWEQDIEDLFDLQILFGMRIYQEEDWN